MGLFKISNNIQKNPWILIGFIGLQNKEVRCDQTGKSQV